jgi:DNA-binding SARP family transcriptional activator
MAKLEISLFGSFQVLLNGASVTQFESVKVRALLAFMAAEYARSHTRESLAALLWPDWPQQSAMSNLRYALADLRKNIGDRDAQPPFLLISRESLQLNREADIGVDIVEFEQGIGEQGTAIRDQGIRDKGSRNGDLHSPILNQQSKISNQQSPISNLKSSIALYRGPFLVGFSLPDSAPFED